MENKNKIVIFIISVIIILVGIFVVGYIQNNPETYFLYQTGGLPQSKLVSDDGGNVNNSQIHGGPCSGCKSSPSYTCKDTNTAADKILISSPPEGNKGGETRHAIVCGNNYYILVRSVNTFRLYGPFVKGSTIDLKSKCCAECIKGFQPQWDSALYCVDKSKMSEECINYLGIQDITGISTADAYVTYCMGNK